MVELELKPQTEDEGGADDSYANLIRIAVNHPPDSGFSVDEMRRRFHHVDALDLAADNGQILKLENAEFEHLMALVTSAVWGRMSQNVVRLVDAMQEVWNPNN